jgi:RNA 2',3'-cyclic 3'-phosphodiesterase
VSEGPGERVRLFVALELPDPVVTSCVQWRDDVLRGQSNLRAVPPASLHVTLCFLGWRFEPELGDIVAACEVVRARPPAGLSIEGAVWLPPRRPRVLALKLADDGGRLAEVQASLSRVLEAGGWYTPESRPFLAHVTVARVSRGARIRPVELPAPTVGPFVGSRVTLFRSRLSASGAHYERLASVDLDVS